MQCLWLLEEEGDSYVRQSKYALALKRYHQIFAVSFSSFISASWTDASTIQTFDEIEDDQFDFHSYCSRKSTLRSYIECVAFRLARHQLADSPLSLMRYSDGLRAHARYQSTAKSAINVRPPSLQCLLLLIPLARRFICDFMMIRNLS